MREKREIERKEERGDMCVCGWNNLSRFTWWKVKKNSGSIWWKADLDPLVAPMVPSFSIFSLEKKVETFLRNNPSSKDVLSSLMSVLPRTALYTISFLRPPQQDLEILVGPEQLNFWRQKCHLWRRNLSLGRGGRRQKALEIEMLCLERDWDTRGKERERAGTYYYWADMWQCIGYIWVWLARSLLGDWLFFCHFYLN